MTAAQFWLLVIILALIVAFVGLPWLAGRRREREGWDPGKVYLQAIDALLRGRRFEAMEALRRVARRETDNLLAYLRLGDLVRVMGYPDKAERIHSGLLARPLDDPELGVAVRESLIEDHLTQRRWDDVLRHAEKLRGLDRKNRVALRALTLAYVAKEEWEKAFESLDEWDRLEEGKTLPRPAQLRIHVAKFHLEQDRVKDARRLLDEAMKLDGEEELGRILLGDVLAREGEHEKACDLWLEFARRNPERSQPVFERLERSYFELGRFGDLLPVYERLSQASSAPAATVALADMHRRRGRTDEAVHLLESVLAASPKNRSARRLLASCLVQNKRLESAMRELDTLLRELPPESGGATCPRCRYDGLDLEEKCPRCGAWQPAVRQPVVRA